MHVGTSVLRHKGIERTTLGDRGSKITHQEVGVRSGGLAEASFSTSLCRVPFPVQRNRALLCVIGNTGDTAYVSQSKWHSCKYDKLQ